MSVKKIALGMLMATLILSVASAALVTLQAPSRLYSGEDLEVTIGGTVRPGVTTDVVLYRIGYTKIEVARQNFTFQESAVQLTFETESHPGGIYRVEIVDPTGDTFGSSSTTWKEIEIVNRTADLTLTSQTTQRYDGTLDLAGRVKDIGDRGVQITVENAGGTVYGPTYIPTDANGAFREEVPIEEPGTYRVDFSDHRGYITTVRFSVTPIEGTTLPTTGIPTTSGTTAPTVPPTTPATTPATPLPAVLALLAIAIAILKRS